VRRRGGRVPGGALRTSRRPAVVFTRPPRIQRFARDAVRRRRSKDLSTNRHELHEQARATPPPLPVTPANAGAQVFLRRRKRSEIRWCAGHPIPSSSRQRGTGCSSREPRAREGPRRGSGGGAVGEIGVFAGVAYTGFPVGNQYVSRFPPLPHGYRDQMLGSVPLDEAEPGVSRAIQNLIVDSISKERQKRQLNERQPPSPLEQHSGSNNKPHPGNRRSDYRNSPIPIQEICRPKYTPRHEGVRRNEEKSVGAQPSRCPQHAGKPFIATHPPPERPCDLRSRLAWSSMDPCITRLMK
jgi:hypothetical protein